MNAFSRAVLLRRLDPFRQTFRIFTASLGLRILSVAIALLAVSTFPLQQREQFTVLGSPSVWDTFARYDSGWYYQIADHGYRFVKGGPSAGVGKPGKIAFFPVYPLLMRGTGYVFGDTPAAIYLGGIIVSWLAFAAAMVVIFHLARLDLPDGRATQAALFTAIFPFSFFFGMVYTESLFLLLTVLAFYAFRTKRWIVGGVAGAIATATRVNGILMLPALAWVAYRTVDSTWRERLRALLGLLLVPAGIAAYSWFIYRLSGNALAWMDSIQRWGYHVGAAPWDRPLQFVAQLTMHPVEYLTNDPMAPYDVLYGVTAIAFVVLIPFVWRKFGAAYGSFMLLNLWLPLSSRTFEGLGRYCSVLFPAFIWMAAIKSDNLRVAIAIAFAMFYSLALALFATIHPLF